MKLDRPNIETYFMNMVFHVASRGSCARRKVGCILVNGYNHMMATGYNGRPSGFTECLEEPCSGVTSPSGTDLHLCQAVHAEANALLQCRDVQQIMVAYITTSPCIECTKMLLNTTCFRIVFAEEYPHPEAKEMWLKANRLWIQSEIKSYSDALESVQITSSVVY